MKTTKEVLAEEFAAGAAAAGEEPEIEVETPEADERAPEVEAAATDETPEAADEPAKGERQRGPDGKFARSGEKPAAAAKPPKAGATLKPAGEGVPAGEQAPASEQLPPLNAPADWRPAAKEHWPKIPRAVQEEAIRLHTEVKKTLQESATARQTAEAFTRTVAPYEHMFRAAGKTPIEGAGWLMQQYAQLQTAPIPQRAQIVAGLIRDFVGVDEAALTQIANAIEGKGGAAAPAVHAALRPEQIQQMVREEAQRMQGEGQRQAELKAIADFEASNPEFVNSLTNEIAALVAIEKRQGKTITVDLLKQVHAKALRINSETAAILKQRDDAKAATERAAKAAKDAAAAAGIKSEPGGPAGTGKKARTTREQLAEEMARAEGGHRV